MPDPDVTAILKAIPLFSDLSRKDLKHLAARLRPQIFEPGENLVTEGEGPGHAFIIIEGAARIMVNGETRAHVSRGSLLGELAVLDGGPRTATVQAETRVEALSLSPIALLVLLENHWAIAHSLLRRMAWRLRQAERPLSD